MSSDHGAQAGERPSAEAGQDWSYARKFEQMDREAAWTLAVAVAVFVCFWAAVLLFRHDEVYVLGLPLWFVLSCLGGYVLSVAAVAVLVRLGMRDFPFDDPPGN